METKGKKIEKNKLETRINNLIIQTDLKPYASKTYMQ